MVDIDRRLLAANTLFAFDLLHEIRRRDHGNILMSPLSVATALAMTCNGSAGDTKSAMANVLHLTGLAAAATLMTIVNTSGSMRQPVEFTVDRPFVFSITDDESGSILFMGAVRALET